MPELFVAMNAAGGIAGFTNDPGLVGGLSLAGRVYHAVPADSDLPFWTGWQLMLGQSVAKVALGATWALGSLVVGRLFPARPWYRIIE